MKLISARLVDERDVTIGEIHEISLDEHHRLPQMNHRYYHEFQSLIADAIGHIDWSEIEHEIYQSGMSQLDRAIVDADEERTAANRRYQQLVDQRKDVEQSAASRFFGLAIQKIQGALFGN